MSVPGSNLLAQALTIISPSPILFYRYLSRSTNEIGLDVSVYDDPICITASVQAVDRKAYQQMGLDYAKRYIMIWGSCVDLQDINRGSAPDQFVFDNERYEIVDERNWSPIDCWDKVLAVKIANE